jgi:hypothetical protein
MNWGKGILIVMLAFITFIIVMIVGFFSHSVDLEDANYYQKEIAYEDEITRLKNASELENKPVIKVTENHVTVQFDDDMEYTGIELLLKRPNDESSDQRFEIENTKFFSIDRSALQKGKYNIELLFSANNKEYLQKESIYLE